jgi:hypothetical protein
MMWGFPVDTAVELLAIGLCRISGWSPVGRRVALTFTEGPGGVFGVQMHGTVERLVEGMSPGRSGQGMLVRLDSPCSLPEIGVKNVAEILLVRRFYGHGPFGLLLGKVHQNGYDGSVEPSAGSMIGLFEVKRL